MTDQEKIQAIITYALDDAQLLTLLRLLVTSSIANVQSDQLDTIIQTLGIT